MSASIELPRLSGTVLVVDDEKNIRRTLRMILEGEGVEVVDTESAEEALELLLETTAEGMPKIQTLLTDVKLPGMSGLQLLEQLAKRGNGSPFVPVILLSGHATVSDAVQATRLGAFDFFEKPLTRDRIIVGVRNALEHYNLAYELQKLRNRTRREIIGDSVAISNLLNHIHKVAPTKARVLIEGESGTGKELVARALHEASERSQGPFVKVNCAAIPRDLIESQLFGHERGAFTGATGLKRGFFELAHQGTLFLDEIGDMDLHVQAKVLRVLQSGELIRVGGEKPIKIDVRVVAATHRKLKKLVEQGEFREDLYFRLNVVPLEVPPLRDRCEDIPMLCRYYLDLACQENGIASKQISPQVLAVLRAYSWPGNVRELRNLMERMAILSDESIELVDVPQEIYGEATKKPEDTLSPELIGSLANSGMMSLKQFREASERVFILQKLQQCGWNVSRTAEILGVERTHLHKKMKLLEIHRQGAHGDSIEALE